MLRRAHAHAHALAFCAALFAAALLHGAQRAEAAEVVYPGVSRIGLAPPGKMAASKRMTGFEDATGSASILVSEFPPQAFGQIASNFTAEALSASGLKLVSRGKLDGLAQDNLFIVADQPVEGVALRRYILLTRLTDLTGLVTVQAPKASKEYGEPVVRKALASLAVRPELTPEQQLVGLPFSIGALAGFRIVRTLSGAAALLTDGPLDRIEGATQPSIVIASAQGAVPAEERASFGRRALTSLPQASDIRVDTDRTTGEGESAASEIVASARHSETGELMTIYQSIRFTATGYLRLVGRGRLDQAEALTTRFRAVRDGLAVR